MVFKFHQFNDNIDFKLNSFFFANFIHCFYLVSTLNIIIKEKQLKCAGDCFMLCVKECIYLTSVLSVQFIEHLLAAAHGSHMFGWMCHI